MTTTATLDPTPVMLDPGGAAAVPLQIYNNGELVEGYHLEVVGPAKGWASIEPEDVSLYPGASTTATVMFFPPRSAAVPAGELRFGVRVVPTEHPEETVVPEGAVEVLPFMETTAELVPRTSHGRRGAKVRVAVDNRGNQPVTVALRGADQADALRFGVKPAVSTVGSGNAAFTDLRVEPVRSMWRGQPRTLPYTATVEPRDGTPVTLDGTFVQEPLIPSWLPKLLLALLALLAALVALWFLVLRGAVESAAQEAVKGEVAAAEEHAAAAEQAAEAAGASAGGAEQSAQVAGDAAVKADEIVGGTLLPPTEIPTSGRLEVTTVAGSTAADIFEVPEGQTIELTDLVLSNPQGDFGRVRLEMGEQVILDSALENFRDLDYHFISPIVGNAGDELVMTLVCNEVGKPPGEATPPDECASSIYFGGSLITPAAPAP
ncbi:COG1470 family protein [Cellulomonas sp. NPDC055163]